jgi:hypothetical protein
MVKAFLIIPVLMLSMEAGATHWLTYYVYLETEYLQGPWNRAGLLSKSGYRYLSPKQFEDLFGTESCDLAEKMLSRLSEENPDDYNWEYMLSCQADTVILEPLGEVQNRITVINEVTATMVLNSFKAVCFRFGDHTVTCSLKDLTLPYLDLVAPVNTAQKDERGTCDSGAEDTAAQEVNDPARGNRWLTWLILSLVLNLALSVYLIIKSRFR